MRQWAFFVLVCCLPFSLSAESPSELLAESSSEPLAESSSELLEQIQPEPGCHSGRFQQSLNKSLFLLPLESSGEYQYCPDSGLSWTTLEPVQTQMRVTVEGIQTAEGQVKLPGEDAFAGVLLALMSGQFIQAAEQFHIDASGDREQWQMQLVPKSRILADYLMRIELEGGAHIEQIRILENPTDSTLIMLQPDAQGTE